IIGGSTNDWYDNPNASGVGKVDTYWNQNGPTSCFVWSADEVALWGNSTHTERFLAEDAAHEAGHVFGLNHQRSQPPGTPLNEYYAGDSYHSPIMGGSNVAVAGDSTIRGTWWKTNVYPGQYSPDDVQDDILTMTGTVEGTRPLWYRPDSSKPWYNPW